MIRKCLGVKSIIWKTRLDKKKILLNKEKIDYILWHITADAGHTRIKPQFELVIILKTQANLVKLIWILYSALPKYPNFIQTALAAKQKIAFIYL